MTDRACPICGKTFSPKNRLHKYCSSTCIKIANARRHACCDTRTCKFCGNPYLIGTGVGKAFCSDECRMKWTDSKKTPAKRRKRMGERECHDCGRPTTDYRCPQCWEKYRGSAAENVWDEWAAL